MGAEVLVACLCAEWCGGCREYRDVFNQVAREAAGKARFAWVDIEDEPEVLGWKEIETFPVILIARGDAIAFYGPVTPQAGTLARLVERGVAGDLGEVNDSGLVGLPGRVRAAMRG